MSLFFGIILFGLACYIMHKSVVLATALDKDTWPNKACFVMLGVSLGLMTGGAFGVVLAYSWGSLMLLLGVSGFLMFDRRTKCQKGTQDEQRTMG